MSAPKPVQTTVRITDEIEADIQRVMKETGASRSLVIRAMLATTHRHLGAVIARVKAAQL
jgi:hypothetical protein